MDQQATDASVSTLVPIVDDGEPTTVAVIVRRSYNYWPGGCARAPNQTPIRDTDRYEPDGDFLNGDCVGEADTGPAREHVDVVVTGSAWAPRGNRAYCLEAGIRVGPLQKRVCVYGDRTAKLGAFGRVQMSGPQPFVRQPLGYRYAYGGACADTDTLVRVYPPNPIGRGFHLRRSITGDDTLLVPHLEDPEHPVRPRDLVLRSLERWPHAPKPASLGWTRRSFHPRYCAAVVPPRGVFCQGASEGLWGLPVLGNERVVLTHLDAHESVLETRLPNERPVVSVSDTGPRTTVAAVLQNVEIDADSRQMALLWRATIPVVDGRPLTGRGVAIEWGSAA